jgi:hypothetical protein
MAAINTAMVYGNETAAVRQARLKAETAKGMHAVRDPDNRTGHSKRFYVSPEVSVRLGAGWPFRVPSPVIWVSSTLRLRCPGSGGSL